MKKIRNVFIIIFLIIALILLASYIYHRINLSREEELRKPLGQMVEVEGHKMSIYTAGTGEKMLVFLSGGGTCSPILDFKSLYSLLQDEYRVAVVEKFGYGFSDVIDGERDIDTILAQTREALKKAGVEGPYVLCPHSMSGIEALYWAQKYPEEVCAIVGLDMAVPQAYADYKLSMPAIRVGQFASKSGLIRLLPQASESDAIKYGTLSEKEKKIYRAVFYHRTATKTMINEVKSIKDNAEKVDRQGIPQTPMLLFISNGAGTGWNEAEWRAYQENYAAQVQGAKTIVLDCPHYIHDHEYVRISEEIKTFLR